jgi:hypothetical protein
MYNSLHLTMTKPRKLPPLEHFREVLAYCPDTGALVWQVDRPNQVRAGSPAGTPAGGGYIEVKLGGRRFKAHRLAWYLHHGTDPGPLLVDHINRDRSDNRACNLRLVDARGNRLNSARPVRPVLITYPDGRGKLICDSVTTAARILRRDRRGVTRSLATGRPLMWPVTDRPGVYVSSGITVRYLPVAA